MPRRTTAASTLGASDTRVTVISNEKFVSAGSTVPVIGAAERKCGVAASGMWPSAANSPEVASSPIQPAPGRYTSAQACRSAESFSGAGPAAGGTSGFNWMR